MDEKDKYVGTIVGESTTQEFRMAVHPEAAKEQDIVAVDSSLESAAENAANDIRVWAKVRKIERLNPLFPAEAGHELAETKTNPLDTVLSFSREMVTAVCQVLGYEPLAGGKGKLDNLRYPPKPASGVYMPKSDDLKRIVLGELETKENRGLDLATMSNRPDIGVLADGHAVVSRHLAILAMTGAGKSWTARRIIEQLAEKNYPIVIFDPHGDYTRLNEVDALRNKVTRHYADFPVFDEDAGTVAEVIGALGSPLSDVQDQLFGDLFDAAKNMISNKKTVLGRAKLLSKIIRREVTIREDLSVIAHIAAAAHAVAKDKDIDGGVEFKKEFDIAGGVSTLNALAWKTSRAARNLRAMSDINRKVAGKDGVKPLPSDRKDLVQYGRVSVVSLAGYTGDFQSTIYSIIADDLLRARVQGTLNYPAFLVLEEAHNFAPARAMTDAERRSVDVTRQIAQEGRKFGLGMMLISQRPSRLDETALSQCNSQIIMRLVNPADQNFVRRTVESLNEDDLRILPAMDVGEAILSGQLANFTVLAKITPPESKGEREEEDAFVALQKAHDAAKTGDKKPATPLV